MAEMNILRVIIAILLYALAFALIEQPFYIKVIIGFLFTGGHIIQNG